MGTVVGRSAAAAVAAADAEGGRWAEKFEGRGEAEAMERKRKKLDVLPGKLILKKRRFFFVRIINEKKGM